jgi:late competence protein required for DNA uptake (superfamily II DNA/RNA helicase)
LEIIEKLNLKKEFPETLKNFLEEMKNKGTSELIFSPNLEFKNKFNLKNNFYKFETHKQLDDFVNNELIKKNLGFESDLKFKGEFSLLKSFDRGFNF